MRRLREERGLTQEELGDLLDTDHKLAGEIERGQRNPVYMTIVRLASALETSPGRIVLLADRLGAAADSSAADV